MREGNVIREGTTSPTVKVSQFTRDMTIASGTQAVTSVGFEPNYLEVFSYIDNSVHASFGYGDLTLTHGHGTKDLRAADQWEGHSFCNYTGTVGVAYGGSLQSFDSDGFTINWTRTGAPTGVLIIRYRAWRI